MRPLLILTIILFILTKEFNSPSKSIQAAPASDNVPNKVNDNEAVIAFTIGIESSMTSRDSIAGIIDHFIEAVNAKLVPDDKYRVCARFVFEVQAKMYLEYAYAFKSGSDLNRTKEIIEQATVDRNRRIQELRHVSEKVSLPTWCRKHRLEGAPVVYVGVTRLDDNHEAWNYGWKTWLQGRFDNRTKGWVAVFNSFDYSVAGAHRVVMLDLAERDEPLSTSDAGNFKALLEDWTSKLNSLVRRKIEACLYTETRRSCYFDEEAKTCLQRIRRNPHGIQGMKKPALRYCLRGSKYVAEESCTKDRSLCEKKCESREGWSSCNGTCGEGYRARIIKPEKTDGRKIYNCPLHRQKKVFVKCPNDCLPPWAWALIIVGVILLVVLISFLIYRFVVRRRMNAKHSQKETLMEAAVPTSAHGSIMLKKGDKMKR